MIAKKKKKKKKKKKEKKKEKKIESTSLRVVIFWIFSGVVVFGENGSLVITTDKIEYTPRHCTYCAGGGCCWKCGLSGNVELWLNTESVTGERFSD